MICTRHRSIAVLAAALLAAGASAAPGAAPRPQQAAPAPQASRATLHELTIARLQQGLQAGQYSVGAVTRYYLQRIEALDRTGPQLHSVIEVNPEALALAAQLDRAGSGKGGDPRGLLFGVPVLLKDNIDTADALHTTAGSLALLESRPARDAFVVRRLRAAGALVLGKTNLSEWANFRSKRASSGWSGRGGQTRNPYAPDRNACGSSSGSGAAIAADLALVAIGTETDGSVVCPASVTGLVGIKPTVGLVSRSGIIPISASQDTAGPMARTVADAATLLTVMAGYDADDAATAPLQGKPPVDYTRALDATSLQGARIGVLRQYAGFHEGVDAVFEQALAALRARGATLIDPVAIEHQQDIEGAEQTVLLDEFKDGLIRYLATRTGAGPRTLQELIAWNNQHRDTEMPYFEQELFLDAQARGGLGDADYAAAHERAHRLAGPEGIDATLAKDHLDALVAPSMGAAWTIDLVNGDHTLGGGITTAPAVAGYPHVTVPMGAVHGLPVGLSFVGTAWSEARLIGYAFDFEQATQARRPPTLTAH